MAMRGRLTPAQKAYNATDIKRYGYKGLPGTGIGPVSPLPFTADETAPVFSELFSMFKNLGQQIFPGQDSAPKVIDAISRNLQEPASAASPGYRAAFGTVDEQLAGYRKFESAYRKALQVELREGVNISAERRRLIEQALKPYSQIKLSLISSRQVQRDLRANFHENFFRTERVIKNMGLPGIYTPSQNPNRLTSRYVASTAAGYEPALDILQSATISIDPFATSTSYTSSVDSFGIGMDSLPPSLTLEQRVKRGGKLRFADLPPGARVHPLDIEAEDVTPDALLRAYSGGDYGLQTDASGKVKSLIQTPGIENQESGFSLITPKLKGLPSTDPRDINKRMDFATATARRETEFGMASARTNIFDTGSIYDITTREGRLGAAKHQLRIIKTYNQEGHFGLGHNAMGYDIGKFAQTARAMPEFEEIGGLPFLEQFEEKMANGGVIDTLDLTREKLMNDMAQILSSSTDPAEKKAMLAFHSMLSETARHRTRVAGQAVSPIGLENIVASTNFLQLLAESGDPDQAALIQTLATSNAAHTAPVDRQLALFLGLHNEDIKWAGTSGMDISHLPKDMQTYIRRAIRSAESSSATVLTVNTADPRELIRSAYEHITQTSAINNVELSVSTLGTENTVPALAGLEGTIKFDPSSKSFKLFTGPDAVATSLPQGFDARAHIRNTLEQMRGLPASADFPNNQSQIISLGISPMQIGEVDLMNRLVTGSSKVPLIDAVTPKITDASEAAFIKGLTATKSTIKLPSMQEYGDLGASIPGLMRGRFDDIKPAVTDAYMKTLYDAGIGSAAMDPAVRSAFVGISEITAPIGAKNTGLIRSALSSLDDLSTQAGIDNNAGRVNVAQGILAENMKNFSDLGILHANTQKEIVSNESIVMVPSSILGKIQTLDSSGKKVGLLTPEGLSSPFNVVRTSIPTRGMPEDVATTVNLVRGGKLLSGNGARAKREAFVSARSQYEAVNQLLSENLGSPEDKIKAMIDAGLATTRQQALEQVSFYGASKGTPERTAKVMELFEKIRERGTVVARIEGEAASDVEKMITPLAGGLDADTLAVQKGFVYQLASVTEEGVTLTPRISEEALREARRHSTGTASDIATRASATSQLELLKAGIKRGEESPGFYKRLDKATKAASEVGVNRELMTKMEKIKPRVYGAVAAVAALSAGYYLATRDSKQDPLDEVMAQQPLEETGPMSINDFNQVDQAMASQTSSRRDPLVTAGVVGNLDRNKIGHTKMGANKYNHLYGA